MSDLVRGRYPVTHGLVKATGGLANATQANVAARSNAEFLGLAGLADSGSALTTAVATAVAVPVEYGDVITKVTVLVGGTAANTPTNQWAALYSGGTTPALLTQSVDGTNGAIAASAAFTFTLAAPTTVTPAIAPNGYLYVSLMVKALLTQSVDGTNGAIAASAAFTFTLAAPTTVTPAIAPNGYLYVSLMVKATGVPSLAAVTVATAVGYKAFTNSPAFLAASHGSALTTTAPATIVTPAAQSAVPVVFLT